MSEFRADIRRIEEVWTHPNADTLDLARVKGLTFQFVIKRDQFKVGDRVVYIPVDAILPQALVDFIGLTGRLGSKNRVKTMKLRGQLSQGLVIGLTNLGENYFKWSKDNDLPIPIDMTEMLGITKYEPPVVATTSGNLVGMPGDVSRYDIEGTDRNIEATETLMDELVLITEKIEGTNFWIRVERVGIFTFDVVVGQKNYAIEEIDGGSNMYWNAARDQGLIYAAQNIVKDDKTRTTIVIRGELIGPGIQSNIYKLKAHEVRVFDIMIDGVYVDANEFMALCVGYGINNVPIIADNVTLRDWLAGRTVTDAAGGRSVLRDTKREGIVIKPMIEVRNEHVGRLILKKRCPNYLAKTGL